MMIMMCDSSNDDDKISLKHENRIQYQNQCVYAVKRMEILNDWREMTILWNIQKFPVSQNIHKHVR